MISQTSVFILGIGVYALVKTIWRFKKASASRPRVAPAETMKKEWAILKPLIAAGLCLGIVIGVLERVGFTFGESIFLILLFGWLHKIYEKESAAFDKAAIKNGGGQ